MKLLRFTKNSEIYLEFLRPTYEVLRLQSITQHIHVNKMSEQH